MSMSDKLYTYKCQPCYVR